MTTRTSVITAVRDGAKFIAEAIASVLPQLEANDEWFVIDDHSTDHTCAIVKSFGDPRVHVLPSQGRGISAARNLGLQKAKGGYIAFVDHDDLWPQGRYEAMRSKLDEMPWIDAVVGRLRVKFEPDAVGIEGYAALDGLHYKDANIGIYLFRQSIIQRAGGFAKDMPNAEDIDFINRLKECGMQIELMDMESLIYRRHATNVTNDKQAIQQGFREALRRKIARARTRTQNPSVR
jgi:glycosyltransferase involved in cell wall biosynthesis